MLYLLMLSSLVLRLHARFSVSLVCVGAPDTCYLPVFSLEIHCRKVSNAGASQLEGIPC